MKEFIRLINLTTDTTKYANLHHLTCTIFSGQIHYLAGLHDNGKTALQNVLSGKLLPTSGSIIIDNQAIKDYNPEIAHSKGIVSIEQNTSLMIPSLSIYENMELLSSGENFPFLFRRKEAMTRFRKLLKQYHLHINPSIRISDLSHDDIFLLHLLKAAYTDARLVILNLSSLNISYVNHQRLLRTLLQMNANGMALLLICDSFLISPMLQGTVHLMRRGYIIKSYASTELTPEKLHHILIPSVRIFYPNADVLSMEPIVKDQIYGTQESIIGILELYYNNYSLPEYFDNLSLDTDNGQFPDDKSLKFIKAESLDCFCNNLSVGDNIALVRYSSLSGPLGYIDENILRYLEREFTSLLLDFHVNFDCNIKTMTTAEKKILGIERWIMMGAKKLVIENPLSGLDTRGQQLLLQYFTALQKRHIRLIFIFYNISELRHICTTIHICSHGKIMHTIQKDNSMISIEELISDS